MSTIYAGSFNGTSSVLSTTDSSFEVAGAGSFWFCMWFNPQATSNYQILGAKDDEGSNRQWSVSIEPNFNGSDYQYSAFLNGTPNFLSVGPIHLATTLGTWHFTILCYDTATGKIHLSTDGESLATYVSSTGTTPNATNYTTSFGAKNSNYFSKGLIDGIAFGTGYLPTDADVTWLYNSRNGRSLSDWSANVASLYASLKHYYTFSNGSSLGADSFGSVTLTNANVTQSSSGIVDPVSGITSRGMLLGVGKRPRRDFRILGGIDPSRVCFPAEFDQSEDVEVI